MAENSFAIGDYIAVLNNLDDYDSVPEPEWPSLMTPMPAVQTADQLSSPTSRAHQVSVSSKQMVAVQENRRNLNVKICQTSVPNPSEAQMHQATKMVVARQIDLSVQTTIKFLSDPPRVASCVDRNDYGKYSPAFSCTSVSGLPFQTPSISNSPFDKSLSESQSFITPDSGIGTPGSDESNMASQEINAGKREKGVSAVDDRITPKPVKRRRRTAMLNMLAARSKKLKMEPSFNPDLQFSSDPRTSVGLVPQNSSDESISRQNDSGIGSSFISEKDSLAGMGDEFGNLSTENDRSRSVTTGKRKRRAKIIRPSEEEFHEKVAAKLVGRLVIKQSIPKYRITYNELLRRVGSPELFNVSALITLFRIKKDAESSSRILNILKDAGYELKKGRRMNRSITRFSSFAEEEAIETGHDVEKISKAYTPVEAASKLFFEKQKDFQPLDILLNKMRLLPAFYSAAKLIVESDQTPLAFHRTPPNAIPLNPELQERLGHLTWVSHGFSKTAYAGLIDCLKCMADSNLSYSSRNPMPSSNVNSACLDAYSTIPSRASPCLPMAPTVATINPWEGVVCSNSAESSYRRSCGVSSECCYQATNYRNHVSYKDLYNFGTEYGTPEGYGSLFSTNHPSLPNNACAYYAYYT